MLDRILNPNPTFYKWDTFWVGFVPAVLLPVVCFFAFYGLTYVNSIYLHNTSYSFHLFWYSMNNSATFLRTSTLCCIPNAAIFFFLINRNYNNASRAVIFATMLYILAIVIKDTL
jgi:hypothetical protein